mmetsp:Transcript_5050/g.7610  ORF Transcript_5050/g.7610 Transcript_5050/m.7610 type:complete len:86 (+) Transcript_5050:219-476(+)
MTPKEQQETWMKRLNHLWNHHDREYYFTNNVDSGAFHWSYCYHGLMPGSLHFSMFTDSVLSFANEEQKKTWTPLLNNFDIMGCYA